MNFSNFKTNSKTLYLKIDNSLVYEPYNRDFGPLNLGKTHSFIQTVTNALNQGQNVIFYSDGASEQKTNAAYLIGAYMVSEMRMSSTDAWNKISSLQS